MPSNASLTTDAPGQLRLTGVLDHATGPQLREAGRRLIAGEESPRLRLDCAGVERSSSVGVSLLLAYLRDAGRAGKTLVVANLPSDMREIACVSGILDLLPLEG